MAQWILLGINIKPLIGVKSYQASGGGSINYIAGLSQSLTASKIDLGAFGFTPAVFRLKKSIVSMFIIIQMLTDLTMTFLI